VVFDGEALYRYCCRRDKMMKWKRKNKENGINIKKRQPNKRIKR
jgi:hypothetical protein